MKKFHGGGSAAGDPAPRGGADSPLGGRSDADDLILSVKELAVEYRTAGSGRRTS